MLLSWSFCLLLCAVEGCVGKAFIGRWHLIVEHLGPRTMKGPFSQLTMLWSVVFPVAEQYGVKTKMYLTGAEWAGGVAWPAIPEPVLSFFLRSVQMPQSPTRQTSLKFSSISGPRAPCPFCVSGSSRCGLHGRNRQNSWGKRKKVTSKTALQVAT